MCVVIIFRVTRSRNKKPTVVVEQHIGGSRIAKMDMWVIKKSTTLSFVGLSVFSGCGGGGGEGA